MNELEDCMLNLLKDLKKNHGVVGLKTEFEDEGANFSEAMRLKEFAKKTGLELTVKIGGCSAVNDINQALTLKADYVVAPMVESPYAAKKFLQITKKILKDTSKLFINIETKYALNYLDEILTLNFTGIVLGRTDLACSFGLLSNEVDNDKILEIAKKTSNLSYKYNKEFVIGGSVSALSIPFFNSVPYLSKFETRKVIFDAKTALNNRTKEALLKAADFELMWLKNNRIVYNDVSFENEQRINVLKSRFKL